jgi:hypothetical protein
VHLFLKVCVYTLKLQTYHNSKTQMLQLDSRSPESAVLVPMLPLASSLPVPRVLDTPRTQLEAVTAANQALLVGSGVLPFSPEGEEDGVNSAGGEAIVGVHSGSTGSNGAQVLQLTDGSALQGGGLTTINLSGGPVRQPSHSSSNHSSGGGGASGSAHAAERDGLGLVLDEQLPGLRSLAAYPWQVLEGKHPQTGRMQVRRLLKILWVGHTYFYAADLHMNTWHLFMYQISSSWLHFSLLSFTIPGRSITTT